MPEVRIAREGMALPLVPSVCLGCADLAVGTMRVWFEPEPVHGLVASMRACERREVLDLPACSRCLAKQSRLRWVAAVWFLLGSTLLFAPLVVAVATGMLPDADRAFEDWRVMGAGFLLGVPPLRLGIIAWRLKDRGGLDVDLASRDAESVTLVLSDAVANRIA